MTLDQLNEILNIYGGDDRRWPMESREQCLQLIATDPAAKSLLDQHQALDTQLKELPAPQFPGLEQRVLTQELPPRVPGLTDRLVNWLIPPGQSASKLFRPAFAACLPLLLGIVVGNFYSFGVDSANDGFQYWEDELMMLSFNEYNETDSAQ